MRSKPASPAAIFSTSSPSVRGAVNGLTIELIEDHIRGHVAGHETQGEREEGAAELIEIVRRYLK